MNYFRYEANRLRSQIDPDKPRKPLLNQISRLLKQSDEVRQRIVAANFRLVVSLARKFVDRRTSWDELISLGAGVLLYAVAKFDVERGFRFSTYATHALRRDYYRAAFQLRRDRRRALPVAPEVLSTAAETVSDCRLSDAYPSDVNRLLSYFDSELDQREASILRARFGLVEGSESQTLQEVSRTQGICKERVRQLQHRAIERLREVARQRGLFSEEWTEVESEED